MRFFNRHSEPTQEAESPAEPSNERRTAGVNSPAFTMSQHVACAFDHRDFMEGKIPLT